MTATIMTGSTSPQQNVWTCGRVDVWKGRTRKDRPYARPVLLALFFAALMLVRPATAQEVPVNAEAESVFTQALEAFDEGDYGMAYRRFRLVYRTYPLNRKTTASVIMAGKALFRQAEYRRVAELMEDFLQRFPTSGYVEEARRLAGLARQQTGGGTAAVEVADLGIVLPLGGDEKNITQALFNGIRLAVEAHNAEAGQTRPVRMVFADSGADPVDASQAVADLAGAQGAEVIFGPLFSNQARAAAEVAERNGVVMMAPLATDEDVAEERRYVFQANPSIMLRGRLMARFALDVLGHDDLGVFAQLGNSISERMAEGFQQEMRERGQDLLFYQLIPAASGWSQLDRYASEELLRRADAIYLPVSGNNAASHIGSALESLDRLEIDAQVLGNSEWHDQERLARPASRHEAVYTNDFFVGTPTPETQRFIERYRALAGSNPDHLAYTGYDVARYLLSLLAATPDLPLREAIHAAPPYQGLALRLDFREGNVNTAMYFHRYRNSNIELIR